MNNDKEMLCSVLEINYLRMFDREVTSDLNSNLDLFPIEWFPNRNYDLKIKILVEALKNKRRIQDIDLYLNMVEGVRRPR